MRLNTYVFPENTTDETLFINNMEFEATVKDEEGKEVTLEMTAYRAANYCKYVLGMDIDKNRIYDYDETLFKEIYPVFSRYINKFTSRKIDGCSVTAVKNMIKKFGGSGFTYHIDRDGSIFETSEIRLGRNNSTHKYNQHL